MTEPTFVLSARDPAAPALVDEWARQCKEAIRAGDRPESDFDKVRMARACAANMRIWRRVNFVGYHTASEAPAPTHGPFRWWWAIISLAALAGVVLSILTMPNVTP